MNQNSQNSVPVRTEYLEEIMQRASEAARRFHQLDQDRVDRIGEAVYRAAFGWRVSLARQACEETKMGIVRDKVLKNILATRYVWDNIRPLKTAGLIHEDDEAGIAEIAQPIGPVFAVTPVTNPTSTVLFKILIALKTRNPIIIRPHGAARRCSCEAARICYEAAMAAGAPDDCIQWIPRSSEEETLSLMSHRQTALVLATGSVGLVRAAYRSGNPAIGVGPGNVPCYIGASADFAFAADQILLSKTFDHGTICASEQAIVVKKPYAAEIIRLFQQRGAYFLNREEIGRLEPVAFNRTQRVMNAQVIGQPATVVAGLAGLDVPPGTTVLIAPLDEVGLAAPLSLEILAPVLAFYIADDFDGAIARCREINAHGGLGHTATIFSNDEERIAYFADQMNAGRILVNTPASQGALGATYNSLTPSLTLGVGTHGKTITTDNISARHLLNIQRIARRRVHPCVTCLDHHCLNEEMDADTLDRRCTSFRGISCVQPGQAEEERAL